MAEALDHKQTVNDWRRRRKFQNKTKTKTKMIRNERVILKGQKQNKIG